jgi:hypothetical protein
MSTTGMKNHKNSIDEKTTAHSLLLAQNPGRFADQARVAGSGAAARSALVVPIGSMRSDLSIKFWRVG